MSEWLLAVVLGLPVVYVLGAVWRESRPPRDRGSE